MYTKKIHPSFNFLGTKTGRILSSSDNEVNINFKTLTQEAITELTNLINQI